VTLTIHRVYDEIRRHMHKRLMRQQCHTSNYLCSLLTALIKPSPHKCRFISINRCHITIAGIRALARCMCSDELTLHNVKQCAICFCFFLNLAIESCIGLDHGLVPTLINKLPRDHNTSLGTHTLHVPWTGAVSLMLPSLPVHE